MNVCTIPIKNPNILIKSIYIALYLLILSLTHSSTNAAVIITAYEFKSDVIFEASGSFNLGAWTKTNGGGSCGYIDPLNGIVSFCSGGGSADVYWRASNFSSLPAFGFKSGTSRDAGSGHGFTLTSTGALFVPTGYISGSELNSVMTFSNSSLLSLGIEPGSYISSWGVGPTADYLIFNVVPESKSLFLFGAGFLALFHLIKLIKINKAQSVGGCVRQNSRSGFTY